MSSDILDCQIRTWRLIFSVLDCLQGNLEALANSADLCLIILNLRVDASLLALWLLSELIDSWPKAGLAWQSWLLLMWGLLSCIWKEATTDALSLSSKDSSTLSTT